jgi:hypothetical protein
VKTYQEVKESLGNIWKEGGAQTIDKQVRILWRIYCYGYIRALLETNTITKEVEQKALAFIERSN